MQVCSVSSFGVAGVPKAETYFGLAKEPGTVTGYRRTRPRESLGSPMTGPAAFFLQVASTSESPGRQALHDVVDTVLSMLLYRNVIYFSVGRERDQTLYGSKDRDRKTLRLSGNDLSNALAV